jgi:hypothetical protein
VNQSPYLKAVTVSVAPAALSTGHAARYLGLGENAFRAYVAPRVPHAAVGSRKLYRVVDLDAWLADQVAVSSEGRGPKRAPIAFAASAPSSEARVGAMGRRVNRLSR